MDVVCVQHAPTLVEAVGADARPDLDVYFSLNCLKFIELIRWAADLRPSSLLTQTL